MGYRHAAEETGSTEKTGSGIWDKNLIPICVNGNDDFLSEMPRVTTRHTSQHRQMYRNLSTPTGLGMKMRSELCVFATSTGMNKLKCPLAKD